MSCVHLAVLGAVGGGLASSAHEWLLQRLGAVTAQRGIAAVALGRCVAAQERAARAVAAALRTSMPSIGGTSSDLTSLAASFIYCTLGNAYQSQGDFNKAIEYHTLHLAIAKEVDDRAGEGRAYGNFGCAYQSQGDFSKAIEYHGQFLAIAKEVDDRAVEGQAYGNLGARISRRGTVRSPSSTTRSSWRLQRRWATGRGRA